MSDGEDLWRVRIAPGEEKVLTLEQVDDLFRLEMIDENTMLWQAGMAEWLPLKVIAGLDDAEGDDVPQAAAPAAPPVAPAHPAIAKAPPQPPPVATSPLKSTMVGLQAPPAAIPAAAISPLKSTMVGLQAPPAAIPQTSPSRAGSSLKSTMVGLQAPPAVRAQLPPPVAESSQLPPPPSAMPPPPAPLPPPPKSMAPLAPSTPPTQSADSAWPDQVRRNTLTPGWTSAAAPLPPQAPAAATPSRVMSEPPPPPSSRTASPRVSAPPPLPMSAPPPSVAPLGSAPPPMSNPPPPPGAATLGSAPPPMSNPPPAAIVDPLPVSAPRAALPERTSRTELLLIVAAALLGLLVTLHRDGALHALMAGMGAERAYVGLESSLGGPGFGTPRAVAALVAKTPKLGTESPRP